MDIRFYGNRADVMPERPSIFLAGPTRKEGYIKDSWWAEAIDIFKKVNYDGTLFIPENGRILEDGNIGGDKNGNLEFSEYHTIWERKALSKVDCIMFWIPRGKDLQGFTTNIEFGEWSARKPNQIILGHPKNCKGNGYIDYLYRNVCKRGQFLETLEETITWSIMIAQTFWKIRDTSYAYENALEDMAKCMSMYK